MLVNHHCAANLPSRRQLFKTAATGTTLLDSNRVPGTREIHMAVSEPPVAKPTVGSSRWRVALRCPRQGASATLFANRSAALATTLANDAETWQPVVPASSPQPSQRRQSRSARPTKRSGSDDKTARRRRHESRRPCLILFFVDGRLLVLRCSPATAPNPYVYLS